MGSELEAILAESEEDEEAELGGLNLEQILREDEADDEDYGSVSALPGALEPRGGGRDEEEEEEAEASASYTARDWAVLQAILKEEDEGQGSSNSHAPSPPKADLKPPEPEEIVSATMMTEAPPPPPLILTTREEKQPEKKTEKLLLEEEDVEAVTLPNLWRGARLEVAQARERRLLARKKSSNIVSPLMMKRRSSRRPLVLTSEDLSAATVTRRLASTGRSIAKLDQLSAVSRQLAKNAQYRAHGPGSACALAMHSKFIAVGTSRGLALIFDHFQEVRQVMGTSSEDGVTTLDLSISGSSEVVACGHRSGKVALWDVIKGVALKIVANAHSLPLAALRFYSESSLVSVDSAGVVNKLALTKATLFASSAAEVECLLDGAAKVAPALALLLSPEHKDDIEARKLVAFSSERTSFVVSLEPSVQVVHKWPRGTPISDPDDQEPAPSVAWCRTLAKNKRPVLARAWGRTLETVALVSYESSAFQFENASSSSSKKTELPAAARCLVWLDGGCLAVVGADHVLRLLLFREDEGWKQLEAVALGVNMSPLGQEQLRTSGPLLYLLSASELVTVKLQTWRTRVEALVDAGEWLEALALSLDSSDNDSSDNEQVAVELLRRYVRLAVENAPATLVNGQMDLARSHFVMLGGVCVEFCVALKRLDLLFGEIFAIFTDLGRAEVYLELLEPYVLNSKLRKLAPEVMQSFVEHFRAKGALLAVERCLLHLEVTAVDFNMLTGLLRKHRLYTAMMRVYSVGLDDYVSALEILLDDAHLKALDRFFLKKQQATEQIYDDDDDDEEESEERTLEAEVRQAVLYCRYCLAGRAFPMGELLEEARVDRLKPELIHFLLQREVMVRPSEHELAGFRANSYGHLRLLMALEPLATLDVLSACLLNSSEDNIFASPDADWNPYDHKRAGSVSPEDEALARLPSLQRFLFAPLEALGYDARDLEGGGALEEEEEEEEIFFSKIRCPTTTTEAKKGALDYVGLHFGRGTFTNLPRKLNRAVLAHLIAVSRNDDPLTHEEEHEERTTVACFLSLAPASVAEEVPFLLTVTQRHQKPRAALTLHRFLSRVSLDAALAGGNVERAASAFAAALSKYLTDPDDSVKKLVFDFAEATVKRCSLKEVTECLVSAACDLARVDCERAAWLVATVAPGEIAKAVAVLQQSPPLQFGFLDALVTAHDDRAQAAEKNYGFFTLDDDARALYVGLLIKFGPDRVYAYVSTHEGYDLEGCLALCEQAGIADATAHLLEEQGDAVGAIHLVLEALRERFEDLRAALRLANRDGRFSLLQRTTLQTSNKQSRNPNGRRVTRLTAGKSALEGLPEGLAASKILKVAVELCERHSQRRGDAEVWFATLDQLVDAKRSLQLSHELPSNAMLMHSMINEMVQTALSAMSEYVPLPTIVSKIITDHADSNLGEFRDIIVSMLDATRDEANIYTSVRRLVAQETGELGRRLKGASDAGRRVVSIDGRELVDGAVLTVQAGCFLEISKPSNSKNWVANSVLPDERPPQRSSQRRRKIRNYRSTISTLAKYAAEPIEPNIKLNTSPPALKQVSVGTRVPGMLEMKPKFYRKLDVSDAAPNEEKKTGNKLLPEDLPEGFAPYNPTPGE